MGTYSSRAAMLALVLLALVLLLTPIVRDCEAAKKTKSGGEKDLPSCDAAQKNYKDGKLYEVLGLKKTASKADIKKAYRRMSVKCHPDKDRDNEKASDNFIAISGAYETLSDENERRIYDEDRQAQYFSQRQGGRTAGNSGSPHQHQHQHQQYYHDFSGGMPGGTHRQRWKPKNFQDINVDDILQSFFKGGFGNSGARGGHGKSPGSSTRSSSASPDGFDDLFRGFSFADWQHGGKGSAGTREKREFMPRGGSRTSGPGGMFGDGMFDGLFSAFEDGGKRATQSGGAKSRGHPDSRKRKNGKTSSSRSRSGSNSKRSTKQSSSGADDGGKRASTGRKSADAKERRRHREAEKAREKEERRAKRKEERRAKRKSSNKSG